MAFKNIQLQRLLLVENNPEDAHQLKDFLKESGQTQFFMESVSSLGEMMDVLRKDPSSYDLLILDLKLTGGTGLSNLLETLKFQTNMPLIVLTGREDEEVGISAIMNGAQDYLVKGQFAGKEIVRAVRYAIERHKLQEELRRMSLFDDLTGLLNRRAFLKIVDHQMKLGLRHHRNLVLFYMDINGLKQINDSFGHRGGDHVLHRAGQILQKAFRDSDIVARIGGDEFAAAALEIELESSEVLLKRLKDLLKKDRSENKGPVLELSIGHMVWDHTHPVSMEVLIDQADRSMYEKKNNKS